MQTFRSFRRVAAFDRCPSALYSIASAGYAIDLIPVPNPPISAAERVVPPLQEARLVGLAEALAEVGRGTYSALLCWTLEDLQASSGWDLPKVFAPQCMLSELAGVSGMARLRALQQIAPLIEGVSLVFTSDAQRENWLSSGSVVPLGVDVDRGVNWASDCAEIVWTGTDAREWALREGHGVRDELLGGQVAGRKLVLGAGEAETWDGWLASVVQARALLCTPSPGHALGCDVYVLTAMAAGMPIASVEHDASPIVDGESGYLSNDCDYLRDRLCALQGDADLARRLGARGRDRVAAHYSLAASAGRWETLIEAIGQRPSSAAMGAPAPRVSIVIPLYNKAEFTEKCLYALAANTGEDPDYEVVLIDNACSDWTQYLLLAFEGDVEIVRNEENIGFARANNQGAALARGEYVLFLNNDTEPCAGWLEAMVQLADGDPRIGVVGAKLLYPQTDTVQHAGLEMVNGEPQHVFRGAAASDPRVCATRDLDMVTGACMLVRRSLFEELGGFDVAYRNGVEDVDLCLQARARGYRVVYCADAVVRHHEGTSEGRFDHVRDNLQRFFAKWQGQFNAEGVFVGRRAEQTSHRQSRALRGYWEGPFFVYSSLAHVNREMALALLGGGQCELGLKASEDDQFNPGGDLRYAPLVARMGQPLAGEVDFHLRHRWPPDVGKPDGGKLVLIQPWEYGRILKSWVEPMRANVDQIWAYTSYVRQVYIDSGFDPQMVKVVPLGVDTARFRPDIKPMVLPTQKSYAFLFVGGTLQRKGIDLLLRAYRSAFSPQDDVCLVIKDMGTKTFYRGQTAESEIAALQRDPDCAEIIYLDEDLPEEQIPSLYAACDCLVHPYRGEGFGLSVAEAMACGLPVAVTKGGACDDFCSEESAFMIPSTRRPVRFPEETVGQAWMLEADVEKLGESMRLAFGDPERGRAMGARGAERIARDFTWERAAQIAHQTLCELCEHAPEAPHTSGAPRIGVAMPNVSTASGGEAKVEGENEGPPVAIIALGGGGTSVFEEISTAYGGASSGYDVTLSPEVGLGDQLEVIRQNGDSAFFVLVGRGAHIGGQALCLLIEHMQGQEDILVAEPSLPDSPRGVGLEEIECVRGDLVVLRSTGLDAIGGFDRSFATLAAIDEAVRQLRRQGGRAVRVLECLLERAAEPTELDAAVERERASIEALDEGDRLRGDGDRAEALSAYRRAVEHKGNFVEAIIVLASMLIEEDLAGEAVGVLKHLVHLDTDSHQAHNYLGMAYHRAGDRAGARASFERAYELSPNQVETLVNLSVFEWEEGHAEAAVNYLEQAAELEPDNRDVLVNTAVMQVQLGHGESGMRLLQQYIDKNGWDAEAVCILAGWALQLGDTARARALAVDVLTRDPDCADARDILEKTR